MNECAHVSSPSSRVLSFSHSSTPPHPPPPLSNGYTPLHWAVRMNHLPIIAHLTSRHPDRTRPDHQGDTPLHTAAKLGLLDAVRLLLHPPSADVNQSNRGGETPLHLAARAGHLGVVECLVGAGAEWGWVSGVGERPVDVAGCPLVRAFLGGLGGESGAGGEVVGVGVAVVKGEVGVGAADGAEAGTWTWSGEEPVVVAGAVGGPVQVSDPVLPLAPTSTSVPAPTPVPSPAPAPVPAPTPVPTPAPVPAPAIELAAVPAPTTATATGTATSPIPPPRPPSSAPPPLSTHTPPPPSTATPVPATPPPPAAPPATPSAPTHTAPPTPTHTPTHPPPPTHTFGTLTDVLSLTHFRQLTNPPHPQLVVVDYAAPWCGPCQKVMPAVQDMAARHPTVHFAKVGWVVVGVVLVVVREIVLVAVAIVVLPASTSISFYHYPPIPSHPRSPTPVTPTQIPYHCHPHSPGGRRAYPRGGLLHADQRPTHLPPVCQGGQGGRGEGDGHAGPRSQGAAAQVSGVGVGGGGGRVLEG